MKALTFDGITLKEVNITTEDPYDFVRDWVGGYIENIPMLSLSGLDMWCNEEGKLIGLMPTMALTYKGELYDVVCGNACILGHDSEGNMTGLSDENIERVKKVFDKCGYVFIPRLGINLQSLRYEVVQL